MASEEFHALQAAMAQRPVPPPPASIVEHRQRIDDAMAQMPLAEGTEAIEHDVDGVVAAVAAFLDDPANARAMGHRAQTLALARHRLDAATRHKQRCYAALLAHG